MRSKKAKYSGILGCQCVLGRPEGCCSIIFLSLKYQGMTQGFWWLSSSPGGCCFAVAVVLAVWQVLVLGQMCPFLSANHDENQNIKLNKNKSTLCFCRM